MISFETGTNKPTEESETLVVHLQEEVDRLKKAYDDLKEKEMKLRHRISESPAKPEEQNSIILDNKVRSLIRTSLFECLITFAS